MTKLVTAPTEVDAELGGTVIEIIVIDRDDMIVTIH